MSYTLRSQIPENTHTMLRLHQEVKFSHNESAPGRKDRDNNDECSVSARHSQAVHSIFYQQSIQPVFIKLSLQISSSMNQDSLLNAKELGWQQIKEFVKQRFSAAR